MLHQLLPTHHEPPIRRNLAKEMVLVHVAGLLVVVVDSEAKEQGMIWFVAASLSVCRSLNRGTILQPEALVPHTQAETSARKLSEIQVAEIPLVGRAARSRRQGTVGHCTERGIGCKVRLEPKWEGYQWRSLYWRESLRKIGILPWKKHWN